MIMEEKSDSVGWVRAGLLGREGLVMGIVS